MTGINATLDIARLAIAANQYGLSVTGQNIANVDNENYSRQLVELQNGDSVKIGNLVFGSGVDVTHISSAVDSLLQTEIYDQQSTTSAYGEMATNLSYIADIFNLDSDNSLDSLFSDFWNSWSELSNNPSGAAERSGVLESGEAIVRQLNDMDDSLAALSTTVTKKIEVAVGSINGITSQLVDLNTAIVSIESQGDATANDLRDQRTALVTELSGLLEISTFERSDGTLMVSTANGSTTLVTVGSAKELTVSGGQIMGKSSGGTVDITGQLSGGSIGGWLDIRDEVIPEYEAELDALTEAFIWNVNNQHSQGVGLNYFSGAVTGSYAVDTTSNRLDTLDYFDNMDLSEPFSVWVADSSGTPTSYSEFNVDFSALTGASTMADVATTFNSAVTGVTASVVDGAIVFTPDSTDYQFAFGGDDSGMAAGLGINTFFTGSSAEDIGINTQLTDTDLIAAGQLDAAGQIASGDNSNALLLAECGELSVEMDVYTYDRTSDPPATVSTITTMTDSYYQTMVSNLGIITNSVDRNLETAEILMSGLQEDRNSVSAVSLDEEMINLVKYQNAYSAASKLLSVADEMLNTIISTR